MKKLAFAVLAALALLFAWRPGVSAADEAHVAEIDMRMMILPGTGEFLRKAIDQAALEGAKLLVVHLDTPGGMLDTTQQMIQMIFNSPIPVVIYVSPSGGTATSAGVFITTAGHIAAMAPGTSIGAAHPVAGDGKDIEGDMRKKAENMAVAMVKAIAEQRGRNVEWVEKSIRESSSITEKEALEKKVVDIVAEDTTSLLKQLKGKEVFAGGKKVALEDYSKLPRRVIEMALRERAVNVFANPNLAALLWLGATTGLTLELYHPGAILPGVVGVICLILALAVSQIIPINYGAVLLLIVGAALIGAELYVPSGILAIGGLISLVLGAMWLVDSSAAPGIGVALQVVIPVALIFGGIILLTVWVGAKTMRRKLATGFEGIVGQTGRAIDTFTEKGKVFVHGEVWNAVSERGIISKNDEVRVRAVKPGMVLEVEKIDSKESK